MSERFCAGPRRSLERCRRTLPPPAAPVGAGDRTQLRTEAVSRGGTMAVLTRRPARQIPTTSTSAKRLIGRSIDVARLLTSPGSAALAHPFTAAAVCGERKPKDRSAVLIGRRCRSHECELPATCSGARPAHLAGACRVEARESHEAAQRPRCAGTTSTRVQRAPSGRLTKDRIISRRRRARSSGSRSCWGSTTRNSSRSVGVPAGEVPDLARHGQELIRAV